MASSSPDLLIGNLLNNACKFSDVGGRIEVTTELIAAHARRS